ncbi:MAG: hypothetical protein EOM64_01580 [Erysipelotrichia bacterium]|nr:hypothetical protein [Erysipelotrichia bacterium]
MKYERPKFGLLLKSVLAAVLLMSGCSKPADSQSSEPAAAHPTPSSNTSDKSCAQDPTPFLSAKIVTGSSTVLYRKNGTVMIPAGHTEAGAMLDISDAAEGGYLIVRDSSFYIDACSVQASERWYPNRTNLIPYAEQLLTADDYTIQDEKGKTLVHMQGTSDTYRIYVTPSESDPRYGIRFQNGIYYIPSSEVQSVSHVSDDVPAASASSVPVLMYHFFYSAASGETGKDGNWVEVQEFDQQLQYLQDNQYAVLSMREIEYFMEGRAQVPEKSAAITIDDNDASFHAWGYPELKKSG